MAHYLAICDPISCDTPYSAIPPRHPKRMRYPLVCMGKVQKAALKWGLRPLSATRAQLSRATKRGCFKRGGFPIWTCPSFFVLFCPFGTFPGIFPIYPGTGDFLDWSFSSFSAYYQHLRGTVPKGSATQSGPFPKKGGKPPGLETPRF